MPAASNAAREIDRLVSVPDAADWASPPSVAGWAQDRLADLAARPGLLADLLQEALADPGQGESYPHMDKVVLWRSGDGALRLRLHAFGPGYADRPHNHRWSFAAVLLAGSYLHTLYGGQDEVLAAARAGREPAPQYAGRQPAGPGYFLHDAAVHSLRVDEPTVSLILRGPAVKERYFTIVPGAAGVADRLEWSQGAARETADQAAAKRITAAGLRRVAAALQAAGAK
ncbi:MAG TPA: hypothetical protein VGG25_18030 [Streptosporangiaceae bacterium]|jgi:hypothetical protein